VVRCVLTVEGHLNDLVDRDAAAIGRTSDVDASLPDPDRRAGSERCLDQKCHEAHQHNDHPPDRFHQDRNQSACPEAHLLSRIQSNGAGKPINPFFPSPTLKTIAIRRIIELYFPGYLIIISRYSGPSSATAPRSPEQAEEIEGKSLPAV
jgi:hypothetical protein